VDGEIDASGGEGFFDFFGKNSFSKSALGAYLCERNVSNFVTGGVDDFDFNFVTTGMQK